MRLKKRSPNKLMKAKFRLRQSKKSKIFNILFFLMPLFIISVLAFGVVVPIYRYKQSESIQTLTGNGDENVELSANIKKLLTLVNNDNSIPESYETDLVKFNGIQCDKLLVEALKKMFENAQKQGFDLQIANGYISFEDQKKKYESEVEKLCNEKGISKIKAKAEVEKYVSPAGKDEHQTGLAVNITVANKDSNDFATTSEYNWLQKNCVNYGFVVRYPDGKTSFTKRPFDATHYRYVGRNNAQKMRIMDMSLEEYVEYINER